MKTASTRKMAEPRVAAATSSLTSQGVSTRPASTVSPAAIAALVAQNQASSAGKNASRARREALSQSGKAALKPSASRPSGHVRPTRDIVARQEVAQTSQSCGCGCNGAAGGCGDKPEATTQSNAGMVRAAASSAPTLNAKNKTSELPTGRALARARRAALSQDGKAGLKRVAQATKIAATMPQQDWQAAITKGVTGRQVAMQHRLVQSLAGRTEASHKAVRPAGRMRARNVVPAPAKVEEGHTLSGQSVTGTMVERSKKVTGNEPGSCRPVTGTEYVGSEQFDTMCSARPKPAPAKVGISTTVREHKVTGTEVGRAINVTGDEVGACNGITGTEYLAAQRFDEFCASRPAPAPAKVGVTDTNKGKSITGTLVNRPAGVTGGEQGADRSITGTGYPLPKTVPEAPEKVAQTHTGHGMSVTGTAVGHTSKITGDETGACRGITGTEYLAQEQYSTVCNTEAPSAPRKVSVMSSRANQAVSGTEVGRSEKVTGDEPGSCRGITGSQYFTPSNFGALCDSNGPKKVASMQTLAGRTLTGTEVGRSPKVTGDEMGGCKSVTGTDYVGTAQQQAVCSVSTPVAPIAKVAIDQTWRGQPVTGAYVGRSSRVTGAESGGCSPISGTPYIGRGQYNSFCESPALLAQEARIRTSAIIPSTAVTGDRPGAGGSVMTGDQKGACEVVSGTPYVGSDNTVAQCVTSGRFVSRAKAWAEPVRPDAPMDFSISSPARVASQQRMQEVTGAAYNSERITGPINKANGLITGTPEFRHRDTVSAVVAQEEVISAARRLTGEGSQDGRRVTGDAWSALSRVSGTEGASSLTRNPTERGNPRGMGMNAQHFREVIEHPAPKESRITGSSGTTSKGAAVTLSGGARG
ncbi:MAG: CsoS2 family carboxysome shell protein [Pseudomonadota bacterium]|nr:CsoS2 family carboxysome shell protein [Pseudomonadota bacterium]MDP1903035.1 CsoS2 family carboxysome shell protein [Pseudomonadota bacterium]MDP2353985.1 CsoS2 family carboxysome shell protein [Pseudomonadota bacterium]